MPTATLRHSSASTSNATSYTTASFTPASGERIFVFVGARGTVAATPTMTDSRSIGFTRIFAISGSGFGDSIYVFRSNANSSGLSMTVTFDCTGDGATGVGFFIYGVSSWVNTVRTESDDSLTGVTTMPIVLSSNVNTNNCVMSMLFESADSDTNNLTVPSGWVDDAEVAHLTPPTCYGGAHINSGETGSTITWTCTTSSAYLGVVVEVSSNTVYDSSITLGAVNSVANSPQGDLASSISFGAVNAITNVGNLSIDSSLSLGASGALTDLGGKDIQESNSYLVTVSQDNVLSFVPLGTISLDVLNAIAQTASQDQVASLVLGSVNGFEVIPLNSIDVAIILATSQSILNQVGNDIAVAITLSSNEGITNTGLLEIGVSLLLQNNAAFLTEGEVISGAGDIFNEEVTYTNTASALFAVASDLVGSITLESDLAIMNQALLDINSFLTLDSIEGVNNTGNLNINTTLNLQANAGLNASASHDLFGSINLQNNSGLNTSVTNTLEANLTLGSFHAINLLYEGQPVLRGIIFTAAEDTENFKSRKNSEDFISPFNTETFKARKNKTEF